MRTQFFLKYILFVIAQMILGNYFRFTPYAMLTILPVLVLCLPSKYNTTVALLIAFATGLAVDLLMEGVLGLNALALVPVALIRKGLCKIIFGLEYDNTQENFSIAKNGAPKVIFAIFIVTALFLAIYILADGFQVRPLTFNLIRYGVSLVASTLLSILVVEIISADDRR